MMESLNWLINNVHSLSDIGRLLSRTYYGSEILSTEANAANLLALIIADLFAVVFISVYAYALHRMLFGKRGKK